MGTVGGVLKWVTVVGVMGEGIEGAPAVDILLTEISWVWDYATDFLDFACGANRATAHGVRAVDDVSLLLLHPTHGNMHAM